jgi:hypothetical protein
MSSNSTYKSVEYTWGGDDSTIDVGISAQTIDDILTSSVTMPYSTGALGSSYTISTGATGSWGNIGSSGYTFANSTMSTVATNNGSQLHVKGDTVIEGDLVVDGVSFKETIQGINRRLAILVPDPKKLEHFEALQKAYKHYKTLEALCEIPEKKDD